MPFTQTQIMSVNLGENLPGAYFIPPTLAVEITVTNVCQFQGICLSGGRVGHLSLHILFVSYVIKLGRFIHIVTQVRLFILYK